MKNKPEIVWLPDLVAAYRKEDFPVEASNREDWRVFMNFMATELFKGDEWMGYTIADCVTMPIRHASFFMGRRERDVRCGSFHTIEFVGPKGGAKITLCNIESGRAPKVAKGGVGDMDVRGTSQDFLDVLFIVLKSTTSEG